VLAVSAYDFKRAVRGWRGRGGRARRGDGIDGDAESGEEAAVTRSVPSRAHVLAPHRSPSLRLTSWSINSAMRLSKRRSRGSSPKPAVHRAGSAPARWTTSCWAFPLPRPSWVGSAEV